MAYGEGEETARTEKAREKGKLPEAVSLIETESETG